MSAQPQFDLCPETGLGCVMVSRDSGTLKIDLMPEEAQQFLALMKAGDLVGAKALLVEADSAAEAVEEGGLRELAAELG